MNSTNDNIPKNDQDLLPYPIIIAAVKGDPDAMALAMQHYESQTVYLSMRKLRDESGNTYFGIDKDIQDGLRSKLIQAILAFRI